MNFKRKRAKMTKVAQDVVGTIERQIPRSWKDNFPILKGIMRRKRGALLQKILMEGR